MGATFEFRYRWMMKTFEIVQENGDQTISVTSWGCQLICRFTSFFIHD